MPSVKREIWNACFKLFCATWCGKSVFPEEDCWSTARNRLPVAARVYATMTKTFRLKRFGPVSLLFFVGFFWEYFCKEESISNQLQFCTSFLWFSESIKTDICSAPTLIRSFVEHKHRKLLVEEDNVKIPPLGFGCLSAKFGCCTRVRGIFGPQDRSVAALFMYHFSIQCPERWQ